METTPKNDMKKALKRAYKQAAPLIGICQIKNLHSGKVFLEAGTNPRGLLSRSHFMLRLGGHFVRELQQDWNRLGEAAFSFDLLEVVDTDTLTAPEVGEALRELETIWLAQLQPYEERGYHRRPKGAPAGEPTR